MFSLQSIFCLHSTVIWYWILKLFSMFQCGLSWKFWNSELLDLPPAIIISDIWNVSKEREDVSISVNNAEIAASVWIDIHFIVIQNLNQGNFNLSWEIDFVLRWNYLNTKNWLSRNALKKRVWQGVNSICWCTINMRYSNGFNSNISEKKVSPFVITRP